MRLIPSRTVGLEPGFRGTADELAYHEIRLSGRVAK